MNDDVTIPPLCQGVQSTLTTTNQSLLPTSVKPGSWLGAILNRLRLVRRSSTINGREKLTFEKVIRLWYMPAAVQGKDHKLARPYHGPYRVLTVTPTNAEVRLISDPTASSIFVALSRVRQCYPEQGDATWLAVTKRRKRPGSPRSSRLVPLIPLLMTQVHHPELGQ